FVPDNVMRDHRKLVLYDVTEAEPTRGAVFVMGIGIGEVYSSATWEDRGFRLSGPATLEARAALRQALRSNGFSESDIPAPPHAAHASRSSRRRWRTRRFPTRRRWRGRTMCCSASWRCGTA